MEHHPAADSFPMMTPKRFDDLVADIRAYGQREPITICDGKILDGRNRYKACIQLGIKPQFKMFTGDPWAFAWSLNGQRRDLVDEQRYLIWLECSRNSEAWQAERQKIADAANQRRSEAAKQQPRVDNGFGPKPKEQVVEHIVPLPAPDRHKSKPAKAAAAKVNIGAVARGDKLAKHRPDLAEAVRKGELRPAAAHRQLMRDESLAALEKAQKTISEERIRNLESVCDIRVCSCAQLFASGIKPDAVITDPPYPREFLPVFTELAEACKTAGVPLVAVMSGQSYLPEVMARMCEHLHYRWTLAYMTPGGQAVQQWQAKVNTAWKPVLLFGEAADWFGDVAVSKTNDNDKRFHGWGQSESGMADLVSRLTKPGQLVCDPFGGAFTTAVVSLALGRRFVGCDIDPDCVQRGRIRVAQS